MKDPPVANFLRRTKSRFGRIVADVFITIRNALSLHIADNIRIAFDGKCTSAVGRSDNFDIVILTIGFGLERAQALSYWRNETMGQPSLDRPRQTYLVSGQGDGAMIDLLRLRISQFRQDRILDELFRDKAKLLNAIKKLYRQHRGGIGKMGLFDARENLAGKEKYKKDLEGLREGLSRRLRRDTEVVLKLRVRKLSELFDSVNTKISFQNKLLVYLLI